MPWARFSRAGLARGVGACLPSNVTAARVHEVEIAASGALYVRVGGKNGQKSMAVSKRETGVNPQDTRERQKLWVIAQSAAGGQLRNPSSPDSDVHMRMPMIVE